jgi:hypothetical protein
MSRLMVAILRVVLRREKGFSVREIVAAVRQDGGKTAIIAAVIAWLRVAHNVQKFAMLCPNLIVRDRLEDDFIGGKVFKDRDLLPDWGVPRPEDFVLTTLGSGREGGWASLLSVLANAEMRPRPNV